ncbi:MAG TPA: histidinol dehydrogenase, partial [Candidatus Binatia bacterium]|nr:histidinol dehydrogenase [Candidatus Binatia bacterium]
MNVLRVNDAHYVRKIAEVSAVSSLFDPKVELAARDIIEAVRARGNAALVELTERFDRAKLSADQLPI